MMWMIRGVVTMSLEKKKSDTKEVQIEGTKDDFKATADIIKSAIGRVGIDLSPDRPKAGKIYVQGEGDVPQFVYPRLVKALNEFVDGLRGDGDFVVDFGYPSFNDYTSEEIVGKSPTLRVMNQIAFGELHDYKTLIKEKNIIQDFVRMIDMTKFSYSKNFLQEADAQWVHAESLKTDGMSLGDKNNQAYFVVLKVDRAMDMKTQIRTYAGLWDSWINSRPNPRSLRLYANQPPRDIGSFMERLAVYTTARVFDLDNAFLAPYKTIDPAGKPAGYNWEDKVYTEGPFKIKGSNYSFYGFVVIGKGPDRKVELGEPKSGEMGEDINLPGLR